MVRADFAIACRAIAVARKDLSMLRRMADMPGGTIGFEAVGEVEDDDWEEAVEPVLRREIAEGRNVRLLYLIGAGAREVEGDAMSADAGFRVRHATSYERVAVVSDEDWMRPALRALSFLLPGKARGFRVRDLADAKAWLSADGD
jgi:SpoIIAA-like